jgi:hypothetical protein
MSIKRLKFTKLLFFCICCIFLTFSQAAIAQAAVRATPTNKPGYNCTVLQVQLHGSQPATSTCLSKGKMTQKKGLRQPFVNVTQCSQAALEITADINGNGFTICFIGSGFANMTDYCGPSPFCLSWQWNDKASYFSSGCSGGVFYTDINGNGAAQLFHPYEASNFPFGNIPNDSLSSLQLSNSCNS